MNTQIHAPTPPKHTHPHLSFEEHVGDSVCHFRRPLLLLLVLLHDRQHAVHASTRHAGEHLLIRFDKSDGGFNVLADRGGVRFKKSFGLLRIAAVHHLQASLLVRRHL